MSKFRLAASILAEENGRLANSASKSVTHFSSEEEVGEEYEDEDEDEEMVLVSLCYVEIWSHYLLSLQLTTYYVLIKKLMTYYVCLRGLLGQTSLTGLLDSISL